MSIHSTTLNTPVSFAKDRGMFKTYLGMGDKNGDMLLSDGCGKEKRGKLLKNCGAASVGEYNKMALFH